jgi:pimeloyl-ACP methyl ester carboxylesterase
MGYTRPDLVVTALSALVPGTVVRDQLERADGRHLRWVTAGAGQPSVVLVAGAGEMALDWAVILPALAQRYRVIAYDRAGLGASDRVRRLTLRSQVQDLLALLETTGPAVLVGHSWGGLLIQLAALERPASVLGLVLVDPYQEGTSADIPLTVRVTSNLMLDGVVAVKMIGLFNRIAAKMGQTLAQRCTSDPRVQALLVDAYLASYATVGQVAMIRAENRLSGRCTPHVRAARAAAVVPDVPMRILTATHGKPPALQRRFRDLADATVAHYPRGEHVVVPDTGHYIHKEQPATVLNAIDAVVAQIGS